jgi:alkaline phosphatase D
MIVVTGDSHNGWAFDLPEGGKPAGVEFGGHSVTSPGYEAVTTGKKPLDVAREVVAASPELKWMDASNRGYMHLSLTPAAATNTWVFMDSVAKLGLATKAGHSMTVRKGRRVLEAA